MSPEKMMLVGFAPDGTPRAWAYDDGDDAENAAVTAEWTRMGRTVKVMPAAEAKALMREIAA